MQIYLTPAGDLAYNPIMRYDNQYSSYDNLTLAGRLPKSFPPTKVMSNPELLELKVMDYFCLLSAEEKLPTPAGLAMAMGLSSFDTVLKVMKTQEDDPGTYPEESMQVLQYARSMIEDLYIQLGLREKIPQAFTKFLLSAYFARSERIISEQQGTKDNNLQINILGVSDQKNAVAPGQQSTLPSAAQDHQQDDGRGLIELEYSGTQATQDSHQDEFAAL